MAIKLLIVGFIALSVICVFIMKKISPEAWVAYLVWAIFVDIVVILVIAVHESWIPVVLVVH